MIAFAIFIPPQIFKQLIWPGKLAFRTGVFQSIYPGVGTADNFMITAFWA